MSDMAGDGARASISAVITLGGPPAAEQKLICRRPWRSAAASGM